MDKENTNYSLPILVGYIYNYNGMATWCIEVARALRQMGYMQVRVAVAAHLDESMPDDVPTIAIPKQDAGVRNIFQKVQWRLRKYFFFCWPPDAKPHLGVFVLQQVSQQWQTPSIVFWNQTNLLNRHAAIPQWVTGWAYPRHLSGYLQKLKTPGEASFLNRLFELLYWYRTDNWAYRHAAGTLCVTAALAQQLNNRRLAALVAAPSVQKLSLPTTSIPDNKILVLIIAAGLDDKRKNNAWLLQQLSHLQGIGHWQLHMAGNASAAFLQMAKKLVPNQVFHGSLNRKEVLGLMAQCHIMLFASHLDDWGFVQVEAMAAGMAVLAPNRLPSTEILPHPNLLFETGNTQQFNALLADLLTQPALLQAAREWCRQQYESALSPRVFGRALRQAIQQSGYSN